MKHLSDTEFIDLLDARLDQTRSTHIDECPECRSQLEMLRSTLSAIDIDAKQATEPSPLFWEAFPSRVNQALDAPQPPRVGFRWRGALAAAAILLIVLAGLKLTLRPQPPAPQQTAAPAREVGPTADVYGDVDEDAAWAVVRMAAYDLEYDDVLAEGIRPTADAFEGLAMELTEPERAELVRLLQRELKRPGA